MHGEQKKWLVDQVINHGKKVSDLAPLLNVSIRWAQQIVQDYSKENKLDLFNIRYNKNKQLLISYAKDCFLKGIKPTKRCIRQKFHIEIYNYFKNIKELYEQTGIDIPLRFYSKKEARSILADYISREAKNEYYPNRLETEKKFQINLKTYFNDLRDLYNFSEINYLHVEEANLNRMNEARFHSPEFIASQKELIKEFIIQHVKRGVYPSVPFIQQKLNLAFYNLYDDIYTAYRDANVTYDRLSPILLGKKKEILLTNVIKKLFLRMNFKILRVSIESLSDFNRGADMTIIDNEGKKYLVEVKAYREDYHVSVREFMQLIKYMNEEEISSGIFITTSRTMKCPFENIRFINPESLLQLLKFHGMQYYLPTIRWIQKSRVNSTERKEFIATRKQMIFQYIKSQPSFPKRAEIERKLGIDIRSVYGKEHAFEKLKKEVGNLGTFLP